MARKIPNSPETQFKPGKSGNPKGRPKKLPDLDILLADVLGDEKDGIPAAKAILMALRAKAAKGDVRAAEVLLERGWGKVKQGLEHSGPDGEPLQPSIIIQPVIATEAPIAEKDEE